MRQLMITSHLFSWIACLLLVNACASRQLVKDYMKVNMQRTYEEAVGDAAKPQPWEVVQTLTPITKDNQGLVWKEIKGKQYLLVASWKLDTGYYVNDPSTGFYNTGKYPIWVTAAPQLQDLCRQKQFGRREGVDLRLKQLLGMPPNVDKAYFVEFWVRPQDLFRPCPDPEVSDKTCGLAFPEGVSPEHKEWIDALRINSYYHPTWDQNYPWTELGYTYDWHPANKNHVGLSEFVIANNANVVVKGSQSTAQYCACE